MPFQISAQQSLTVIFRSCRSPEAHIHGPELGQELGYGNHLNRAISNHTPLLVNLRSADASVPKPFKFQNFWVSSSGFKPTDDDRIGQAAVCFFQRLLTAEEASNVDELLIHIPNLVSADQNGVLLREVTMEEVKGVVFKLDGDSAPGADGFTGTFFRHCWDIVALDALAATRDFLAGTLLPKGIASTLIVLIPKKPNPATVAPYATPRGCRTVTHLAFADDVIIFVRGDRRSVGNLVHFLNLYQTATGQRVNNHKGLFISSRRCGSGQIRRIQQMTGFRHGALPLSYLGCNLYAGRRKKVYFQFLIDKFITKLAGWQKKLLSQGGRLILIKHVLSAIPTHVLAIMDPPSGVLKELEQIMANFFWGQTELGPKHHRRSWEKLCFPMEEDGLGIRSFKDIQGAFSCKLWWRFRHSTSLWALFMRSRYSEDNGAIRGTSRVWRRMLAVSDTVAQVTRVIDLEDGGRPAWTLTSSGDFIISSAWEALRSKRACFGSRRSVWSGRVPCKIAVFMWKLLNKFLPFPDALQRFGLHLPSKCSFCLNGESQEHIFSGCFLASEVWMTRDDGELVHSDLLLRLTPRERMLPRLVVWEKPPDGCVKLNVDGSSLGNPGSSGAGEVLRDSGGSVLRGFSSFLGSRTNMEAEALALLEGMLLSTDFPFLQVEMDSQVLLAMVNGNGRIPWTLWKTISRIQTLARGRQVTFTHVYREANGVADALANLANSTGVCQNFGASTLPDHIQGLARLDRMRVPYVRLH
ncbi:unnamed protein product [Coffea canephora]|uniref:RNase H type-1 domain-containing protein n=1 Tax=Coffea canephora TaxID=49390 RepID=A0A068URZ7_COFCA|nr:unnamed protein product [Coffea canephora]